MISKIIKVCTREEKHLSRKWKGGLLCLFSIAVFAILGRALPTKAAEAETVEGILQQITKDTELMETPDENANILEKLEAGTALIVYGEPEDSWSRAEYKGMKGYIKSDVLEKYSMGQEEELEEEFSRVDEEISRTADEYEFEENEKHSSNVWMVIIGILVVAILVLGVISALKKEKETS